jgi:hypothetical protein
MLAVRRLSTPDCPAPRSGPRRRPRRLFSHVLSILLLGACQRVPLDDDDGSAGEGPEDSDGDSDGGAPTTGPQEPPPDFTPVYDCEPNGVPPCPSGQKCTAVSEGGLQNHFKCVPDDGQLPIYEACVPDPDSGQDGCGAGTVCLAYTEQDLLSGKCFPVCRNDSDCEPGLCATSPFSGTTFCADDCDPEAPLCLPGLGCRPAYDRFICEMILDIDTGLTGADCFPMSARGCADNHACMPNALVPMCNSASCCTTTCNLSEPDPCPSPTLCTALFPAPAPGFEDVGACFVPA